MVKALRGLRAAIAIPPIAVAVVVACGDGGATDATPTAAPGAAVEAAPAYGVEEALPQARFPGMLDLAPIPGDREHALLATKFGHIYRVSLVDDEAPATEFLDLRDRLKPELEWEEGLLAVTMPDDYQASRRVYVYYSADDPRRTVLSRFIANGDAGDPASEVVLLEIEQPYGDHNGGGLEFGPDGMLYLGVGDGGGVGDPHGHGQDPHALLGSILRLDVSGEAYGIPPDNPFADGGGRPEVFAHGFRNPWRLAFEPSSGALWALDVGQDRWEEVNVVVAGGNYGWNLREGPDCYAPQCVQAPAGLGPLVAYSHDEGCAVTGAAFYRGDAARALAGRFVYADYCSGRIWAVDAGSVSPEPDPLVETGLSIASLATGPDGEIYILTFQDIVYRLIPEPSPGLWRSED